MNKALWLILLSGMWHADRPNSQQSLARSFASLLDDLPTDLFLSFDQSFWNTIARDWSSIDALRMDKYLYLTRCYINSGFRYLKAREWREGLVSDYLDIIREYPLNSTNIKIPDGLRYHVLDCWVEEIDKVDEGRDSSAPVKELMKPVKELEHNSPSKTVRARAKECNRDERLADWLGGPKSVENADEDEEEWRGIT